MAYGKYAPKLVDQFNFRVLMVLSLLIFTLPIGNHNDYFCGFLNCVILFLLQTLGELICPAYHELCDVDPEPVSGQCPNACNFNGDCINGRCSCFLGFNGYDCSQRKLLNLFLHYSL